MTQCKYVYIRVDILNETNLWQSVHANHERRENIYKRLSETKTAL